MKELLLYIGLAVVGMVVFIILMRRGAFLKISEFFRETEEELRKCTWPTWGELKGSTVVVFVAIALLGIFTMTNDFVFTVSIDWLVKVVQNGLVA
jgi:preprotein translocase subunit SecE